MKQRTFFKIARYLVSYGFAFAHQHNFKFHSVDNNIYTYTISFGKCSCCGGSYGILVYPLTREIKYCCFHTMIENKQPPCIHYDKKTCQNECETFKNDDDAKKRVIDMALFARFIVLLFDIFERFDISASIYILGGYLSDFSVGYAIQLGHLSKKYDIIAIQKPNLNAYFTFVPKGKRGTKDNIARYIKFYVYLFYKKLINVIDRGSCTRLKNLISLSYSYLYTYIMPIVHEIHNFRLIKGKKIEPYLIVKLIANICKEECTIEFIDSIVTVMHYSKGMNNFIDEVIHNEALAYATFNNSH